MSTGSESHGTNNVNKSPSTPSSFEPKSDWTLIAQGAEARLWKIPHYLEHDKAAVCKERFPKTYRHPVLDERLTKSRCKGEAKTLARARRGGVPCPAVWGVVLPHLIYMEYLEGQTVRHELQVLATAGNTADMTKQKAIAAEMGTLIGKLHNTGQIHGDLTTSNMVLCGISNTIHLIDFGLARVTQNPEELAVDLYVLERAILSTHPNLEDTEFIQWIMNSYKATYHKNDAVMKRLGAVRLRGRKRDCFG